MFLPTHCARPVWTKGACRVHILALVKMICPASARTAATRGKGHLAPDNQHGFARLYPYREVTSLGERGPLAYRAPGVKRV